MIYSTKQLDEISKVILGKSNWNTDLRDEVIEELQQEEVDKTEKLLENSFYVIVGIAIGIAVMAYSLG